VRATSREAAPFAGAWDRWTRTPASVALRDSREMKIIESGRLPCLTPFITYPPAARILTSGRHGATP
jgi:hypothetical protein